VNTPMISIYGLCLYVYGSLRRGNVSLVENVYISIQGIEGWNVQIIIEVSAFWVSSAVFIANAPISSYEIADISVGPECPRRHVRRIPCGAYMAGFCPDGPDCKMAQ